MSVVGSVLKSVNICVCKLICFRLFVDKRCVCGAGTCLFVDSGSVLGELWVNVIVCPLHSKRIFTKRIIMGIWRAGDMCLFLCFLDAGMAIGG